MKVGTDGVLLGSWTDIQNTEKILDVGTGSGLIALMMAQRSHAHIDGVEIEENAFLQASENAAKSPWHNRIDFFHDSFQHFSETTSCRYDLIVSNPPFFKNSLQSPSQSRTIAKHDAGLNYNTLLSCSAKLLIPGGRLSCIIPAKDQKHFTEIADFYRLMPSRLTWVKPSPDKEYSRCLLEFTSLKRITCLQSELNIRKNDLKSFSEEFTSLTKEFYLKF